MGYAQYSWMLVNKLKDSLTVYCNKLAYIFIQVNVQISNKSALHCAVAKNDVNVLKVILEFKPNLEIKVSTLHYTIPQ